VEADRLLATANGSWRVLELLAHSIQTALRVRLSYEMPIGLALNLARRCTLPMAISEVEGRLRDLAGGLDHRFAARLAIVQTALGRAAYGSSVAERTRAETIRLLRDREGVACEQERRYVQVSQELAEWQRVAGWFYPQMEVLYRNVQSAIRGLHLSTQIRVEAIDELFECAYQEFDAAEQQRRGSEALHRWHAVASWFYPEMETLHQVFTDEMRRLGLDAETCLRAECEVDEVFEDAFRKFDSLGH